MCRRYLTRGPPTCCRRAGPGCTWPTRWGSRCSATSGPETDARDSTNLAELLRMHRLPGAWLAPPAVRELRELVRYRAKLVALRSGLKAQVHAVLARKACGCR
jgi:hypothetical protein